MLAADWITFQLTRPTGAESLDLDQVHQEFDVFLLFQGDEGKRTNYSVLLIKFRIDSKPSENPLRITFRIDSKPSENPLRITFRIDSKPSENPSLLVKPGMRSSRRYFSRLWQLRHIRIRNPERLEE
jgi:hypothetical protein